jgi:F-type H+-transporting ATPase subunit b
MVEVNWTIAVQIVNFLVLIYVLNLVCYKPIRNILLQRKAKVQGLENGINATTQQSEEKNQAFTDGIKKARAKGQKEKEEMLQAASEEEQTIISQINAKAKDELNAVKAKIVKDTDVVKTALEKEIDAFADAITKKILGRAA